MAGKSLEELDQEIAQKRKDNPVIFRVVWWVYHIVTAPISVVRWCRVQLLLWKANRMLKQCSKMSAEYRKKLRRRKAGLVRREAKK